MKKVTAVEWLVEQISYTTTNKEIISYHKDISELVKQAKEMEKQQIVDSFEIGYENGACVNEGESIYHGHNYYQETFKSE